MAEGERKRRREARREGGRGLTIGHGGLRGTTLKMF